MIAWATKLMVVPIFQGDSWTRVTGEVSGLAPGLHGFHIHVYGDYSEGMSFTWYVYPLYGKDCLKIRKFHALAF